MASEASREGQRQQGAPPDMSTVPPKTALGVWLSWLQHPGGAPVGIPDPLHRAQPDPWARVASPSASRDV